MAAAVLVVCCSVSGAFAENEGGKTVITAERMTLDYQRYIAVFEDNVVVSDPQIRMRSDRLNVLFDGQDSVKAISAVGNVHLEHDGKKGKCGKAVYVSKTGEILLLGDAELRSGRDTLTGDRITVWLGEDRMVCEPGRLVIFPEEGKGDLGEEAAWFRLKQKTGIRPADGAAEKAVKGADTAR